jgi:DNA-binding CsgD family transcriptional regulator
MHALVRHASKLYAARTLDACVDAAFRLLHAAVPCDCVSVFYQSAGDRMLRERDSRGRRYDVEFTARHAELTPAIPIALAHPGLKILPTRTGLPLHDDELQSSPFYREVMRVQGWRHAVALCFWDEPPTFPILVFSVKRTDGEDDFSDEDLSALETVHGFLEPAVRRLRERATVRTVYEAIATPLRDQARGIVVLDGSLRVVGCNRAGRRLCSAAPRGTVPGRRPRPARSLVVPPAILGVCRDLLEERDRMLRRNAAANVARRRRQLSVPDASLDLSITMVCLDSNVIAEPSFVIEVEGLHAHGAGEGRPSALAVPAELTKAERDVAVTLAEGLSNQEIADRLGKSLHAVKFLLHRVYRKTGVSGRAGLVALLRSPTLRPASSRN